MFLIKFIFCWIIRCILYITFVIVKWILFFINFNFIIFIFCVLFVLNFNFIIYCILQEKFILLEAYLNGYKYYYYGKNNICL
jgi:hypothetical protein